MNTFCSPVLFQSMTICQTVLPGLSIVTHLILTILWEALLTFLFFGRRNGGTEKLSTFSKVFLLPTPPPSCQVTEAGRTCRPPASGRRPYQLPACWPRAGIGFVETAEWGARTPWGACAALDKKVRECLSQKKACLWPSVCFGAQRNLQNRGQWNFPPSHPHD